MPNWCPKHKMHTIDESCPKCERERLSKARKYAIIAAFLSASHCVLSEAWYDDMREEYWDHLDMIADLLRWL